MDSLRILIIEDSLTDFKLMKRQLEGNGFSPTISWAKTPDEMQAALKESWDLVLADYNVPHMQFERTLKTIKGRYPDLPVILVSGSVGEEQAVEFLKGGMADFVHKDNLARLAPSITRALNEAAEHRARVAAEESLTQSERRFRSIFDHAPVGIAIGEIESGRLLEVNNAWLEIFGFRHDEVIGRTGGEAGIYMSSVQRAAVVKHLREKGRMLNEPLRLKRKSGEVAELLCSAEILTIGPSCYLQMMLTDVTEELKTRNALAASEETLRKLYVAVNQSPTGIVITDRKGAVEFVNPRFSEMTGYRAEEMIGRNPQMIWQSLCEDGEVWRGDFCNTRKDGTTYWEHDIVSPIRDQAGEVTHFMAIKEDISEKRAMEEQLRQSQKMEAVGQLAGGIAHDFNNIMQIIASNAFLQSLENSSRGVGSQHLDEISKAVEHGSSLTKSLLIFSRKTPVALTVLNLNEVVQQSRKLATRLVTEDIVINTTTSAEPLMISGDAGLVQQIIFNLVTNARDAIKGPGSITISTQRIEDRSLLPHGCEAAGDSFALLTLRDTGHGIPEAIRGRIFEPFFTTKEVGKGTGLGLAMIYGTVQRMNGCIAVESPAEGGTEFRIFIPLVEAEQAEEEPLRMAERPGNGELVLVVEDDEAVRVALTQTLALSGYLARGAASGEEALEAARRLPAVALAVIDMILPGMNGMETAQALRRINPALPVIFLTGYDHDILEDRGIKAVVQHKPIQSGRLVAQVREILGKEG